MVELNVSVRCGEIQWETGERLGYDAVKRSSENVAGARLEARSKVSSGIFLPKVFTLKAVLNALKTGCE